MLNRRLEQLKIKMAQEKLEAVLISSPANITYFAGFDSFLKEERDGYLLITGDGNYILTHSIYSKSLKGKIPGFKVVEISRREPPEEIVLKIIKGQRSAPYKNAAIGIEEVDLRVYEYKRFLKVFKNLKNFDPAAKRTVKSKEEIELIEKACNIGDQAFDTVLKKIKKGISERKLAFEIDHAIRTKGWEPSFRTIAAFGKNTAHIHHKPGMDILKDNQFVLIDFGVCFENYCSDMTRTVFFGKPDSKQKKIYETVLEAQQKAVGFIKTSLEKGKKIKADDVDKIARDYIISKGFPSIPHSLGHGIGLEVHEFPHISQKSKEVLEDRMVFSIEPGIYLLGKGGVRIEDLYVLENGKLRALTHSNSSLIELK